MNRERSRKGFDRRIGLRNWKKPLRNGLRNWKKPLRNGLSTWKMPPGNGLRTWKKPKSEEGNDERRGNVSEMALRFSAQKRAMDLAKLTHPVAAETLPVSSSNCKSSSPGSVKLPNFGLRNSAVAIPSQVVRDPVDLPIENEFYEESGEYRDLSWWIESRNQWLADRILSRLGSDVVQERIMYQAVVGPQIPLFEKSAEIRDNGRQDANGHSFLLSFRTPS